MCLRKTHDEPKIAENDIEVWKVLTSNGLSPYQGYQYHPGMNRPGCAKTVPVPAKQQFINGGYLHAYTSREPAEKHALFSSSQSVVNYLHLLGKPGQGYFEEYVVQRMLIPKGSMYYEGYDDDICAECLYWPEEGTAHPNPIILKEV